MSVNRSEKSSRTATRDAGQFPVDQIREQVEKIVRSRVFVHSRRMQRFLKFTVEQALKGEGGAMKEYPIALAVFDKPQSFDPRLDPIVRVEAGRLRSKLLAYYEGPGRLDPIRITYRKRSYVPDFSYPSPEKIEPEQPLPAAEKTDSRETGSDKSGRLAERQEVRAMAVLPFINLSVSQKHEYFSDAITAEIINVLNQTLPLNVVSRTSVLRFKDTNEDIREIASRLGVDAVLEGSVLLAGKRVRVAAQLADAANGYQIWSQIFDREITDIFDVQKDLAQAIAHALKVRLQRSQPEAITLFGTEDSEAYHLYLRGRYFVKRGLRKDLKSAIKLYAEAITKDPNYAAAYVGLADAYTTLSWWGATRPNVCWKHAEEMAKKAVQIDSTLGQAYIASAHLKAVHEWAWEQSEKDFLRGLELSKNYAGGHHLYSLACLLPQGRLAQAEAEMGKALKLDPNSAAVSADFALILYCRRQYGSALEQLSKSYTLDPLSYRPYLYMGYVNEQLSNLDEALRAFNKARELSQQEPIATGAVGRCLGLMGETRAARGVLKNLLGRSRKTYLSGVDVANVYIGLGDLDGALEWLVKACEDRCPRVTRLKVDPCYDPIKSHPKFPSFLKRMKMDYVRP